MRLRRTIRQGVLNSHRVGAPRRRAGSQRDLLQRLDAAPTPSHDHAGPAHLRSRRERSTALPNNHIRAIYLHARVVRSTIPGKGQLLAGGRGQAESSNRVNSDHHFRRRADWRECGKGTRRADDERRSSWRGMRDIVDANTGESEEQAEEERTRDERVPQEIAPVHTRRLRETGGRGRRIWQRRWGDLGRSGWLRWRGDWRWRGHERIPACGTKARAGTQRSAAAWTDRHGGGRCRKRTAALAAEFRAGSNQAAAFRTGHHRHASPLVSVRAARW